MTGPGEDYEARQLALIREQRLIVDALRAAGYQIDFLFAPPPGPVPEAVRAILSDCLVRPISLESRLMICDLMERLPGASTGIQDRRA